MKKVYIIRDEEYLEHHGIKGQKWGIRRYQNDDGTLTEAGKKRYLGENGKKNWNEDIMNAYLDYRKTGKFDKKLFAITPNGNLVAKSHEEMLKDYNKQLKKEKRKSDSNKVNNKKEAGKKVLIGLGITGAVAATIAGAVFLKKKG